MTRNTFSFRSVTRRSAFLLKTFPVSSRPCTASQMYPPEGVGETGMGLFIVKTLTEAQDGRIWVDTELGVGSAYNVLIPVGRETPIDVSTEE